MAMVRRPGPAQPAIRALTKQEIDRRIQGLMEEIALLRADRIDAGPEPVDSLRPRWIEPAELVRRLRGFIVHN